MSADPIRIGGLFRCCIESIRDGQPGVEGEIRGCTVGRGCGEHVVFRDGVWEWLPDRPVEGTEAAS